MGTRILLIEDNKADRELTQRALSKLAVPPGPVDLVTAGSWGEGRAALSTDEFDLLILDFDLPDCTGLDILNALAERPHPPAIMMTGQGDLATAVETLRAGAYDYVPKSADSGPALRIAVERVLERVQLERDLESSRVQLAAYARDLEEKIASRTAMLSAQAREIETLYLKSEEAERLKREIMANVSHELRTPLNAILGYLELLPDELPPETGDSAREMLRGVLVQSQRLNELVHSLLALQHLRNGTAGVSPSRFDLRDVASELHHSAELLNADKRLELGWKIPSGPCKVVSDREKVRAIAFHLLSNAIKFTPHGSVRVALAKAANGGVAVTVSDTGIGLPSEARALAFDDFRQLDGSSTRPYEGVGLGLGIVRRYTNLLGGTLRLDSVPGEGTTVEVVIPGLRGTSPDGGRSAPHR